MADIFCDDGGSNTAPHETWAKAATTLATAVSAASAGDDIIIGHDHSEAPGANTLYTFPGTISSINRLISCTSTAGGSVKIYNKADNIQIDLGTGAFRIDLAGYVHMYGVSIKVGTDFRYILALKKLVLDDCELELSGNNSSQILLGVSTDRNVVHFKNTNVNWSTGGATSAFDFDGCNFSWHGGLFSFTGIQPTALWNGHNRGNVTSVAGVDLSALTTALVDVSETSNDTFEFHHCLLNSGVSLTTGAIAAKGIRVLMSGCDDTTGNDLYRLEYVDFWGSTVHDDAIHRTSGASDGTTNISWKMVSTANAVEFSEPTKTPRIYAWVDSTGSKTFTVHTNMDIATDLDDDEIWLEVEYLEASADVDSAFADDRMADITATPAAQATSTEAWTGTGGFTNENKHQLVVTVTVNRVGPVVARVCLAKPSVTVYVDPKLEIA